MSTTYGLILHRHASSTIWGWRVMGIEMAGEHCWAEGVAETLQEAAAKGETELAFLVQRQAENDARPDWFHCYEAKVIPDGTLQAVAEDSE